MTPLRLAILGTLLLWPLAGQDIRFSPQGRWLGLWEYAVSVHNAGEQPLRIEGNLVWREAQLQGLGPKTQSRLQEMLRAATRASPAKIAMSVVEGGSWAASAIVPLVGRDWPTGQQVIPPLAAGALRLYSVLTERHAEPAPEMPADYPPPYIDVQPGGTWVGTLIGGP